MGAAELAWVADCQQHLINEAKIKLWKSQLQLFRDEYDLWRCGGRLVKADISYEKSTQSCCCLNNTILPF